VAVYRGERLAYVPGDDVFFLGRFIGHDGVQRNAPAARFGNISMLPEPIRKEDGSAQLSFLVEARSLSGYSGSPVFVYRVPNTAYGPSRGIVNPRLLGVDWGHLRDHKPVLMADKRTPKTEPEREYVEQNSGMMAVVPAWRLAALLGEEHFADLRREEETLHERLSSGTVEDRSDQT
jgi:hypothetical protein